MSSGWSDEAETRPGVRAEAPARGILREAERFNATVGHENRGFLSWSHGFVPVSLPLTRLHRDFAAWDQLASDLPALHRSLALRGKLLDLPLLDASEHTLDDGELLRAAALLGLFAHAYWHAEPKPPDALPPAISVPWRQVRARLRRTQEVLSYADLIVYNWQLVDPGAPDPMRVENLRLLVPTVGNQEEHVFYLTQLEILSRSSVILRAMVEAQDAALHADPDALEQALVAISACLERLSGESLLKINPNPHSRSYVDPVVWAKTVAPLAVPIHKGDQGPSGTASPIFGALDSFFGRAQHASFMGREIQALRAHYPPYWRELVEALGRVSVLEAVEREKRRSLSGALREALELYAGDGGFLGRHRMKVYGYLELAFKVGRSVTVGGFTGAFRDRTWDQVDGELVASRKERLTRVPHACDRAPVLSVYPRWPEEASGVRRVTLDVSASGARFRPGSRCAVLPEHSPLVVERTRSALHALGDELLPVTEEWQEALELRLGRPHQRQLPLVELLRYGCLRPVSARLAEALHAQTQNPRLLEQIERGYTERWELWELLEQIERDGFETQWLWQGPGGVPDDRLSRLIPPERFRIYSVSSVTAEAPDAPPSSLELTVGELTYHADDRAWGERRNAAAAGEREGAASSFLARAAQSRRPVSFRLERPARFQLPSDPARPIILFAAGTGVAPFRSFIEQRARQPSAGKCWLLWSLRAPGEFLLGEELRAPAAAGLLRLDVAFTRVGGSLRFDPRHGFVRAPGLRRRIDDLISNEDVARELWRWLTPASAGGQEASLFVCGRSSFAATVLYWLGQALQRFASGPDPARESTEFVQRLAADNRLVLELYSDTKPVADESRWIDVSEVAQRNSARSGYWLIIDQSVYDMTEFANLHPGGRRIIEAYAGMDATHGFARSHEHKPDVDAMREIYRIGRIRPLRFDDHSVKVEAPSGPTRVTCKSAYQAFVRALQLVVEMENAVHADYSLQERVTTFGEEASAQGPYKRARAAETHVRFLRNCLKPLRGETLPALWLICQGLFAPQLASGWMAERLQHASKSPRARYIRSISDSVLDELPAWNHREARFFEVLGAMREEDLRLLADLKHALVHALQIFERLELETRSQGAEAVIQACRQSLRVVEAYYERLDSRLRAICQTPTAAGVRTSSKWPMANIRRVHDSEYWVLEEFPEQQIAVLTRTPLPAPSLEALAAENDALLDDLTEEHRRFGLVVDTRQAPLRNDSGFEQTMAKLRRELGARFQRAAILLDSPLGELQAERLERDERRNTLVTRSVAAAFRFAAGGR